MKFKVSALKGKQWYHQRFDGAPLYLLLIGEAEVKREKRKPEGTEADVRVCFFKDSKADWYLDMADVRSGSEAMIKLAKTDPQISAKLLRAWKNDEKKFKEFFNGFDKIEFKKLTDAELLKLYREYYKLNIIYLSSC